MSDVPPTESIPKPEEPKAPAPAPQFQQVPPPNYYQFPSQGYYQFPPQGYYPPQGFPNYPPPQPMPYFPNPWMFQQAPPQQFQFQSQSKRDQDFEEGLNRLRKEYATAPMEDDRLSVSSLKSTDSTRTTDSVRDREDYLSSLRDSSSYNHLQLELSRTCAITKVRHQLETAKQNVLARAVQLVKTKTEVVDFILAACPTS
ncbi:hypothetical protein TVAGG3_0044420, partial [Trichomonas vaginalis G3]|uniref:hypothetical protein n=1 Tax=Trichomonas vaginalis (strain ATCC PRA-98 / G3) TaxID=412133 RepID=UPI0021E52F57